MFRLAVIAGTFVGTAKIGMTIDSTTNDRPKEVIVSDVINMSNASNDLVVDEVNIFYNERDILSDRLDDKINGDVAVEEDVNYSLENTNNLEQSIINSIDYIGDNDIISFWFDGDDLGERLDYKNALNYKSIFDNYGNTYGIDPNLLIAIAAQEGSGVHKEISENGHALGIMQVEMDVWCGKELTAYNFDTGMEETIVVNKGDLTNVDYNIKVGAMIFQGVLEQYNYNIPLALQAYNFGYGNIKKMLNTCFASTGVNIDEMIDDVNHTEWMNYRNFLGVGDGNYVEHVLENLENNEELVVRKRNLEEVKIQIHNTGIKNKIK